MRSNKTWWIIGLHVCVEKMLLHCSEISLSNGKGMSHHDETPNDIENKISFSVQLLQRPCVICITL